MTERVEVPRLAKFRCWWCQGVLVAEELHHSVSAVEPRRRCCVECHQDPQGVYRSVYPRGETQERAELARVLTN